MLVSKTKAEPGNHGLQVTSQLDELPIQLLLSV